MKKIKTELSPIDALKETPEEHKIKVDSTNNIIFNKTISNRKKLIKIVLKDIFNTIIWLIFCIVSWVNSTYSSFYKRLIYIAGSAFSIFMVIFCIFNTIIDINFHNIMEKFYNSGSDNNTNTDDNVKKK